MAQKYKILLPKTKFPLKVSHATSDPSIRAAAKFDQLYKWQLENRDPNSDTFILHDGPPYANGSPHMGHALNKILKDIINRYKLLQGCRVLYQPGWDCHGLPIELKACRDSNPAKVGSVMEIREKAAAFARSALTEQKEAFQRWGCFGDWENPYLTMSKEYEKSQIGVFYEMYKKGCIYRGFKPVYWSPSSQTALAEAELEYRDHVSRSVYTLFPLCSGGSMNIGRSLEEISALVWTTTPWTLVANKAICYHPDHTYSLVKVKSRSKIVLIGEKCLERVVPLLGECEVIGSVAGSQLEGVCYTNPLDKEKVTRPFLPGVHVSAQEGTGLVHTAPSHGHDDHAIGVKHNLDLTCAVDSKGRYSDTEALGEEFCGLRVLNKGNEVVCAKLSDIGALLHEHSYTHRYPYDWRTKKPVIIRATKQWFASVRSLKERAKTAIIDDVAMHPPSAQNRLLPMLDGRDDWCISRQRFWGVPLPIFYHTLSGEPLINDDTISHVENLIGQHGTDCWWKLSTRELLPTSILAVSEDYVKGEDTMDVWFDSGSSWASVLKGMSGGGEGVADMYLEGSDQHRGWFQSSLLTSIAVQDRAPYRTVLTHGFVLDKSGDKMSKSLGNVISPDDILDKKKFGADVMRLWVASSDYFRDIQLSDGILRQNADLLQKVRNTCRFMLGNLSDFQPEKDLVAYSSLCKLDRYILHVLSEYSRRAMSSYDKLEFSNLCHALVTFVPNDLSSFYFDIVKDRLYCEERDGDKRRATQTTLYHILWTFVRSVAPILPHLAEEVAQHTPMEGSVFKSTWKECPSEWTQSQLAEQFQLLRSVISLSNGALEKARVAKTIRSSLEAEVTIHTDSDAVRSSLHLLSESQSASNVEFPLSEYLLVSEASIQGHRPRGEATIEGNQPGSEAIIQGSKDIFVEEDTIKYHGEDATVTAVARPVSSGCGKCPRCWKWACTVEEELCERCKQVEHQNEKCTMHIYMPAPEL